MSDEPMVYAARYPGKPGFGAIIVDNPEHRKSTAKEVAKWMRAGATVERVTLDAARDGISEFIAARNAAKSPPPSARGEGE